MPMGRKSRWKPRISRKAQAFVEAEISGGGAVETIHRPASRAFKGRKKREKIVGANQEQGEIDFHGTDHA